jgi:hypothetical protein
MRAEKGEFWRMPALGHSLPTWLVPASIARQELFES